MRLLVAIPCLNEEKTVAEVIGGIPKTIEGISKVTVLVVDDGSTDGTSQQALGAGAVVMSHPVNRGVGAAFQTALGYAISNRFDMMVNIDADGQFDPNDIPKVVGPIVDGEADFVTASRFIDPALVPRMPWIKKWGNYRMSALISGLLGRKFHDVSCGFRAYSREAMLRLNLHGVFTYTQETFLDLTYKNLRIKEVPISVKYFADRRSRVANSITQYAMRTLAIILRVYRDYYPLKFFWGLSSIFVISGIGISSILLTHYIQTGMFSGHLWAGFTGAFLLAIGFVLIVVGVVADILERLRRNQERMLYYIKETLPAQRATHAPDNHDPS